MILYPAIDLLGGHCLPVPQGAARAEEAAEVFDGDPLAVARHWRDAGATWLHVVDLDGTLGGEPHHLDLIGTIVRETGLSVQCGGGLRSEAAVEAAFSTGVERVILGTAALRSPELLAVCLNRWGRRVVVSVDSRGGKVLLAGWLEKASESAVDFATHMADAGVRTLVLTNVERDGTLAGVDLAGLAAAHAALPTTELIAAGGIASLDDVRALAHAGLEGAILGRALYSGALDLAEALQAITEAPQVADAAEAPTPPEGDAPAASDIPA